MRTIHTVLLSTLVGLSACGQPTSTPNNSALHITNGLVIAENERPEVVNLYRKIVKNGKAQGGATCTGTWIGENTILTAAHCTGDGPIDANGKVLDLQMMVFEITDHTILPKATKLVTWVVEAYRNPLWDEKKGYNRYDLAVLTTQPLNPQERPRGLARIATKPAQAGDAVEIIGYGFNNMSFFGKKGDDLKRIGTNTLASVKDGFLEIRGALKDQGGGPTGDQASAGEGDSGGPAFREGEQIGVASGGGSGGLFPRGEASYVDLNSPESRLFLARFGY